MEKVLNAMPVENKVKADRVLELNADHPLFAKLEALQASGDTDTLKTYADVLFTQAQLIEGILPEDPAEYSEKVLQLLR